MPDLYTATVFVTACTLLITATDVTKNRLISKDNKRRIIVLCLLIGVAISGEWIGVKTNGADPSLIWLHKSAKLVEFCIAPCLGVVSAMAYGRVKSAKIAVGVPLAHAVFEVIALANDRVFSVDANNVYRREGLYWVYVAVFAMSVIYCFACIANGNKRYQARLDGVMVLILCFLAAGIGIQMVYSEIRIDFMCVAIGNLLLYNYHSNIVNQIDVTTKLLNRRCFERSAETVKPRVFVLVFDIDRFKSINDTYGHAEGDKCLESVAKAIFSVYGRYGFCYRIGGDEFCVILRKNTDNVRLLNESFKEEIKKLWLKDKKIYGVSVGYACYDGKKSTFDDALKKADEMMYKNK